MPTRDRLLQRADVPDEDIDDIIALADQTGLLRRNFDKAALKAHKARIKDIGKGGMEPTGATIAAIEAVQAALIAATTVAAVGATSGG